MKMQNLDFWWWWSNVIAVVLGTYIFVFGFLRKINGWYHVMNMFGNKQIKALPPGDMGWPLIGNMWAFVKAFKSQVPESFLSSLKNRYGETGIYKTSLLWKPCIIVCTPELCRKVLKDGEHFKLGYPYPSLILGGQSSDFFLSMGHKRFRSLTTSQINGHEALSKHIGCIDEIVITTLEELSTRNQPVQFLHEMNKVAFKVIMTIFLGSACDGSIIAEMEEYYSHLFCGLFSSPINIPGFAFHRTLNARKMLIKIIQSVLSERREKESKVPNARKGIIDFIKEFEDEEGEKLDDEHIIIEEQEEIIKRRPSTQKDLTLSEIKQMKYLSKVIDETLRSRTNTSTLLREAKKDTNLNGYFIPKGWKVLVWHSAVHMDPEIYHNPKQFLPSRWDDLKLKAGGFLPFGAGSNTCPGADLAKLEISILLHHFLLNYKFEQLNPRGPVNYLPSPEPADDCRAKIIKLN
ncbi:defensin-like protein [Hibiscus syriacus]|uniref:Defensin-like protein n=1 Tax=Hibiscus syriacus TaxID=106335 RepID=A0A6A2YJK1_HIBSY|nr:defensin-like protein [Hibiscus syriacus]